MTPSRNVRSAAAAYVKFCILPGLFSRVPAGILLTAENRPGVRLKTRVKLRQRATVAILNPIQRLKQKARARVKARRKVKLIREAARENRPHRPSKTNGRRNACRSLFTIESTTHQGQLVVPRVESSPYELRSCN